MSERRSQVDDFTRLTEETERLARHVEDLRLRIAATTAKRRASSGTLPAQSAATIEGPHGAPSERPPHGPISERPPHGAPSERPPHGSLSERVYRSLSDRPYDATERAHDPAAERAHDAAPERAYDAAPERACDASERPQDAATERPHDGATERPRPRHSPFPERTSCLANVSRWLPPLRPAREILESGIHERMGEAGRYCIVTPRKQPSALLPRRRPPKADVA
ncbi:MULTISPECIES: hypothetical protein [Sorangium]|uniref:Uncharacterized protein n=1 Tax=Sorangium cellulosum TaxID=56 RepID=A0A4P2QVM0_SORCE|nr:MULTISPECIES: hypothetical protein [Sorangium]AUX34480.1 hypothetical protein SOCE836_066540 [Sorangium cellulosum]WCQ93795.1 hypothetical protein NQZ70_06551 [Sorangium sp. Soce836]